MSLQRQISEGEHTRQDFKFRIDDQKKIARTLCAFANSEGGRLLIGVKDSGKVVGCNPEEELHMIEGAAAVFSKPEVVFQAQVHLEGFRQVLEILVPKSEKRIHQAQNDKGVWRLYFRLEDETFEVNKILRKVWLLEEKKSERPNVYDEETQALMKQITDEPISLSQLYKRMDWPKRKVDALLPFLIHWDVVDMHFHDSGVRYSLSTD